MQRADGLPRRARLAAILRNARSAPDGLTDSQDVTHPFFAEEARQA